jgi:hypothetical protein
MTTGADAVKEVDDKSPSARSLSERVRIDGRDHHHPPLLPLRCFRLPESRAAFAAASRRSL